MRFTSLLVVAVVPSLLVASGTARAEDPPRLLGLCFGPYRDGESPVAGVHPVREALEQDIQYMASLTDAIRTYSVGNSQGLIPEICDTYNVNCYPGAWLGASSDRNAAELDTLVGMLQRNAKSVRAVIIGNEVVLRGDLSAKRLIDNIKLVRDRIPKGIPVGTAEPWHIWEKKPELARNVDILFVHVYPYWDGVRVDNATKYLLNRLATLQRLYPDKELVLAEHGWPSAGDAKGAAIPSPENQAKYLAAALPQLRNKRIPNFVFSFADESWKSPEGGVEANWGLLTSKGEVKDSIRQLLPTAARAGLARPPRNSTGR